MSAQPSSLERLLGARSALVALVALGLVLAVLLGGCGGSPKPKSDDHAASPASSGSPSSSPSSGPSSAGKPAADPGYGAPKVGDCHRMSGEQSVASVDTSARVSCRHAHTSLVVHVGYRPRPVTPTTPVAQRRALGQKLCRPAYQRTVGGTLADRATSVLTWTMFTPSQAQLERGARWVRCDVVARSGAQLVALPTSTPMLARGVPEQVRICQAQDGSDISCSKPHAFRVQAVYRAVLPHYPDLAAYTRTARARCRQLVGSYGGFWQPPSRAGWDAGDRFVRCLSPRASPSATP